MLSIAGAMRAHDWQKIRFVLIFERFPPFLMGCVG